MAIVRANSVEVAVGGEALMPSATFSVGHGEALAVLGPNGSGKTTLLRTIAGLTRPTAGEVLLEGRRADIRSQEFRACLAALIGTPPFARDLTLAEHLAFVAATWGATNADALAQAHSILDTLGIIALKRRFAHELSSGQRQLFCLCLTLVRPSQVLVLDEPEQRLDQQRSQRVIDVLAERRDSGTTLIVATHSTAVVEKLATTTYSMAEAVG